MEPLILIEKVYTETEGHLSEVMKHEKRHYKVGKDKDFFIKLKLASENYLGEHTLRCDMLMDQIDKGYPIVENTARLMEYSYMEGKLGYAVMKVTIHSITRSHQSIPFRLVISSIPKNQQSINYSVMTDPIIVVSKMPSKKKVMETANSNVSNNTSKNNNTNNTNGNISQFSNNLANHNHGENNNPNLEEISRNIQQMMEMLQTQSNMLQKVSTAVENQNLELYYHQMDQPTKKKQRSQMTDEEPHEELNDPFYLGQEPLQASIYNLINEYKELPTKDKKQKRLRQLLYDLQGKDQNLIREFAEDVLEIFNNPVTLQPNPPVTFSHSPNTNFSSFLNNNTSSHLNNNTSHLMNNNTPNHFTNSTPNSFIHNTPPNNFNNNTSHLMNNNLIIASSPLVSSPGDVQFNNSSTSFLDDILLNPGDNLDSDIFQNNTFPF